MHLFFTDWWCIATKYISHCYVEIKALLYYLLYSAMSNSFPFLSFPFLSFPFLVLGYKHVHKTCNRRNILKWNNASEFESEPAIHTLNVFNGPKVFTLFPSPIW